MSLGSNIAQGVVSVPTKIAINSKWHYTYTYVYNSWFDLMKQYQQCRLLLEKITMHFQTVSRGENETKAKSLANHQSCQPHAMLTPKLLKGPSFLWPLDNNMMDNFPDDSRHISENRALKTSLLFFRGNSIFRVVYTPTNLVSMFSTSTCKKSWREIFQTVK